MTPPELSSPMSPPSDIDPSLAGQIGIAEDRGHAVAAFCACIETLVAQLEAETGLVGDGRLIEAAEMAALRQAASDAFLALALKIEPMLASENSLTEVEIQQLRAAEDLLIDRLSANLATIAAARNSAETLVRSVAREIERQARPTVYSLKGALTTESGAARGITINRAL